MLLISTDAASRHFDCCPSNLAQYSHRLKHILVRDRHNGLLWPAPLVQEAALLRSACIAYGGRMSVAKAIEITAKAYKP